MTQTLYGGAITVAVEVAFTTANPLTASPTWTDITAYVESCSYRGGRWTETTNSYDAGKASVTLDNSDRRFDPLYSAGPYFGQLLPMKQVRIRVTYNAVTYDVFRGFVDGWPQGWEPNYPKYSETTISCTDAFGYLSTKIVFDRYANEVLLDTPDVYYRCGDPGNDMADSSGNGKHGAWFGNTETSSDVGLVSSDGACRKMMTGGTITDIAYYHGRSTGSYFQNTAILGSTDISLECWLFFQMPAPGIDAPIPTGTVQFYMGSASIDPSASILIDQDVDRQLVLTCSAQNKSGADQKSYQVNAPLGQWNHVVLTYVGAGALIVYLNGKVVASGSTGRVAAFYQNAPQVGVYIENGDETGTSGTDWFVDEVAVYDHVLTASRVAAHYIAGRRGAELERSGARVGAVLDAALWPSGLRTIGSGDSWLAGNQSESSALDYLQAINTTEQGRFYAGGDGTLVFRERTYAMETTAQNTSQATFGDSGSELRYTALVLDGGNIEAIRNSILVTPVGGVAGRAEDATSVAAYGTRQQQLESLHTNQKDARNLALWLLTQYKDASLNFTEMEISPLRDKTNLFPQVLGRVFGDRVTVTRRPQGIGTAISQERCIDGIEHTFDSQNWRTRWYLTEPIPNQATGLWWRVGDATYGKVGTAILPY